MRRTTLAAAGAAALLALAGCSTSTSAPSTLPTESASPMTSSPTPSETVTDVLPPVEIDGKKTVVDVTVGETLDVISEGVKSVSTDNPDVLAVSQPKTEGGAEFNAGAEVVGAGTAKLTVTGSGGDLYTVTVTATE